jgi:hypothetical protein
MMTAEEAAEWGKTLSFEKVWAAITATDRQMAGGVIDPDTKNYAYRAGFFVLGLSGESVRLVPPPEGFQPKTW